MFNASVIQHVNTISSIKWCLNRQYAIHTKFGMTLLGMYKVYGMYPYFLICISYPCFNSVQRSRHDWI